MQAFCRKTYNWLWMNTLIFLPLQWNIKKGLKGIKEAAGLGRLSLHRCVLLCWQADHCGHRISQCAAFSDSLSFPHQAIGLFQNIQPILIGCKSYGNVFVSSWFHPPNLKYWIQNHTWKESETLTCSTLAGITFVFHILLTYVCVLCVHCLSLVCLHCSVSNLCFHLPGQGQHAAV